MKIPGRADQPLKRFGNKMRSMFSSAKSRPEIIQFLHCIFESFNNEFNHEITQSKCIKASLFFPEYRQIFGLGPKLRVVRPFFPKWVTDLFLSQYSDCDEYNGLDETVSRRRVRRESQSYLEDYVDSLKYQIDKLRLQIDDLELWTQR